MSNALNTALWHCIAALDDFKIIRSRYNLDVSSAEEHLQHVINLLRQEGASLTASIPPSSKIIQLDMTEVHELLASARMLLPLAQKIDVARGLSIEYPIGSIHGYDLERHLSMIISRLEGDVQK